MDNNHSLPFVTNNLSHHYFHLRQRSLKKVQYNQLRIMRLKALIITGTYLGEPTEAKDHLGHTIQDIPENQVVEDKEQQDRHLVVPPLA